MIALQWIRTTWLCQRVFVGTVPSEGGSLSLRSNYQVIYQHSVLKHTGLHHLEQPEEINLETEPETPNTDKSLRELLEIQSPIKMSGWAPVTDSTRTFGIYSVGSVFPFRFRWNTFCFSVSQPTCGKGWFALTLLSHNRRSPMNQVELQKANMWCLELVFLHNILIGWRQVSSPEAELWGRRRGHLCSHAGSRRFRQRALRCFTCWGRSKAVTIQQTGVRSKCGGERDESGRSCQTTWKQERYGCNFWRMAWQSLSP